MARTNTRRPASRSTQPARSRSIVRRVLRPEIIGTALVVLAVALLPFLLPLTSVVAEARDGLVGALGLHVFTLVVLTLTIGLLLEDMTLANGALGFIPESHAGELFDQYDEQGQWKGCLNDRDVERLDVSRADYIEAAAGAITVHNCRTVHGSPPSRSADGRALLLNAYASADAFPYTPHPEPAPHVGEVIRGQPAKWAHHDPRPCLIPPDWSGGYTSIFAAQAGEDDPDAAGSVRPT